MVSEQSRATMQTLRETPAFGADGFDLEALRQCMATRREPVGMPVRVVPTTVRGVPCEWVFATDADPDVRLLYLHGGGYVSGSAAFYLTMAAHVSMAARCAVLLPGYQLAPENPFPAGLEDCLQVHEGLVKTGPHGPGSAHATFIAGDSAGGGLTLASLIALRDRGLPSPKAAIALSPWTDLTLSGASILSEAGADPIMDPKCLPEFVHHYLDGADPHHPLASPAFADYTGVPPLLIQVGEHEIIRDDSVRAAAKARADGVDVTLEIWPGMWHVFQSHEPLLPEGREAIQRIGAFILSHAGA